MLICREQKEIFKCAESFLYFIENYWAVFNPHLKDDFEWYPWQLQQASKWDDKENNIRSVVLGDRRTGQTELMLARMVWTLVFGDKISIGIMSPTFNSSSRFLKQIKSILEHIKEKWGLCYIKENNYQITLDNGNWLNIDSIKRDSLRGAGYTDIFIDQAGYNSKYGIWTDIMHSLLPTMEYGLGNMYISTTGMLQGTDFKPWLKKNQEEWSIEYYSWQCVPNRDFKWYKEIKSNFGGSMYNDYGIGWLDYLTSDDTLDDIRYKEWLYPDEDGDTVF